MAPSTSVHRTRSAIRITVLARVPPGGRFETHCGGYWGQTVSLGAPIDGRRIDGQNWPSRLGFGALAKERPRGIPRLLGLSPAQAVHVLRLFGFRSQLSGSGREIVAQIPGWGLVDPTGRSRPDPYDGVVKLRAGRRIEIPTTPPLKPGTRFGVLTETLSSPTVAAGAPIALFDAHGRLLARFHVPFDHPFRLRLAPGRYLLLADNEGEVSCYPAHALVRPGKVTRISVPSGCDVGGY